MPVRFGDRIAEPLVGDLVRARAFAEQVFGQKDAARIFHPAVTRRRWRQDQLLVWVRPDQIREELDDLFRPAITFQSFVAVFREEVIEKPHVVARAFDRSDVDDRKLGRADDHAVGVYRRGLDPMRHDVSVLQARFFDQLAVGDDFQARGRSNEELDRGLVVRVINRGEPVARAVGPVVAEDREVAELVLADDQSVRRPPVVFDRNPATVAATVVSRKCDAELAARMCELRFALIFVDMINGQSHKIERDRFHAVLFELEEDFRLGLNLVARVFDRQAQPVINGVERRVARVIVGGDGQDALRIKQQDENELGEPFHRKGSFPRLGMLLAPMAKMRRKARGHRVLALDHYFDIIADPRDAAFDYPPDLSALAEESLRQADVYLRDRAAGPASLGDLDDRFAYAKPRAGFERIEVDVFGEEVSAQASG